MNWLHIHGIPEEIWLPLRADGYILSFDAFSSKSRPTFFLRETASEAEKGRRNFVLHCDGVVRRQK